MIAQVQYRDSQNDEQTCFIKFDKGSDEIKRVELNQWTPITESTKFKQYF